MKRIIWVTIVLAAITLLTGCGPILQSHFTPSFADMRTLQQSDSSHKMPIDLRPFTSSLTDHYRLICRPHENIQAPILGTFESGIHNAIEQDLDYLKLYHPYSFAYLQGNLNQLYFDTGGFGEGAWVIDVSFIGESIQHKTFKFNVKDRYEFAIDQADPDYCQQIADSYPGAIRDFIQKLYQTPEFQQIVSR